MNPIFIQAEQLFRENRFAEALEKVEKALEHQPKNPTLVAFKALCFIRLSALLDAEKSLKESLKCDPNHDFTYYVYANLEIEKSRYKEAEKWIENAININPIHSEYYGVLALCKFNRHDSVELIKDIAKQGLNFDPHNNLCQNVLSMVEMRHGKKHLATQIMEFNLEKNRGNSFSLANQGWNFLHQGKHQEARELFHEALKKEPEHEWARVGLLQSLKCRFPLYRFLLHYLLMLSRKSPGKRLSIIMGIYGVVALLTVIISQSKSLAIFSVLLFGALIYTTWFGDVVANLYLMRHPEAKKWLREKEKNKTRVLFGILTSSLALLIGAVIFKNIHLVMMAMGLFLMSIPAGLYFQEHRPRQKYFALTTVVLMGFMFFLYLFASLFLNGDVQHLVLKVGSHGFLAVIFGFCVSMVIWK